MVALLLAAVTLAGCTVVEPTDRNPPLRPTDLAVPAQPLEPTQSPQPNSTSSPTPSPTASATPTPPPPAVFRVRMNVTDRSGDRSVGAPAYADLASVVLESSDKDVRVTVTVAGNLSATLGDGEVMGIGVDLYRDNQTPESDYQLFADGGRDGWFAYLQTPDGFVQYPGTFHMGGPRLVFQVPVASVGGLSAKASSTFLDWSEARPLLNAASSDRAPDSGRGTIGA